MLSYSVYVCHIPQHVWPGSVPGGMQRFPREPLVEGGIVLVQCYMQLSQTDHSRPIVMTTIPSLTTVPSSGQAVRSDCYTGDTSKWLCLLSACTLTDGCCSPDHGLQVSWSGPGSGEIHINTGGNSVVKKFQKQTCAAGRVLGGGGGSGGAFTWLGVIYSGGGGWSGTL